MGYNGVVFITRGGFKMNENDKKRYSTICFYIILVILAGAVIVKAVTDWQSVYSVFKYVFKIFSPFIMGIVFAFMLSPLVNWVNRRIFSKLFKGKRPKLSYGLAMTLTYTVIIGLVVVMLIVVVPQIYFSLVDLANKISEQYFIIMERLTELSNDPNNEFNLESLTSLINNSIPQLVTYLTDFTSNLIPILYNTSLSFLTGLWNVILGVIISLYILGDKDNLLYQAKRLLCAVVPAAGSETFFKVGRDSVRTFSKYVTGKSLDSFIIGCITFVVMCIFRLDFKLLISVLVGVTNMIPYFGPFVGGIIGALILLISNPLDALLFGVLILIIQQFDGLYLGPKILGESTGLKPLWVIFAIMIGGSLFGVIGMLVGVPTVAVIGNILDTFIKYRLDKRDINYKDGRTHSIKKKEKPQ